MSTTSDEFFIILQFLVLVSLDAKTDIGADDPSLSKTSQGLKDKGVKVYAVGVKPRVNQTDLEDVASRPFNIYIIEADQLSETGKRIADSFNGYVEDTREESGQCFSWHPGGVLVIIAERAMMMMMIMMTMMMKMNTFLRY